MEGKDCVSLHGALLLVSTSLHIYGGMPQESCRRATQRTFGEYEPCHACLGGECYFWSPHRALTVESFTLENVKPPFPHFVQTEKAKIRVKGSHSYS